MTTIIISVWHICVLVIIMLFAILAICLIYIRKKPDVLSQLPAAIAIIAFSVILVIRDCQHNASIILYCIDGFIVLAAIAQLIIRNQRIITWINASIIIVILMAIAAKFIFGW